MRACDASNACTDAEPVQQNVPALSSFFEQMDALLPSFLNTLSTTRVRGSRVLLK